jgi:hypothetical protein
MFKPDKDKKHYSPNSQRSRCRLWEVLNYGKQIMEE